MKDKKFLVLILLVIAWLALFVGTAIGEIKVSPNVERFATVIVLVWFAYWSYTLLRWAKSPEPTDDKNETPATKCSCGCKSHSDSRKDSSNL